MNRSARTALAKETVEIVARGWYAGPAGRVHLAPLVERCFAGTRYLPPEEAIATIPDAPAFATLIEVRNETTLHGIARLLPEGRVAALNFASAKNPGGGFLNGSQAQEESLARSSALYESLCRARSYYDLHRAGPSCLYTDAMILSPDCPIFRDDEGRLLEAPQMATFLTSAAPNAGAIKDRERPALRQTLYRRAGRVLALAASEGHESLVLGAWGCGVFRNDPEMVAGVFAELLKGEWNGRFRRVVFSVLDTSRGQATFHAFQNFTVPK